MSPGNLGDSDDDLYFDSGDGPSVGDLDSDVGFVGGLESDEGHIHGLGESMDEDSPLLGRPSRRNPHRSEADTDLGPVTIEDSMCDEGDEGDEDSDVSEVATVSDMADVGLTASDLSDEGLSDLSEIGDVSGFDSLDDSQDEDGPLTIEDSYEDVPIRRPEKKRPEKKTRMPHYPATGRPTGPPPHKKTQAPHYASSPSDAMLRGVEDSIEEDPLPLSGAAGPGGQGTLKPGYPAPRGGAAGSGGQGTLRPGYPAPRKGAAGPGGQGTLKPGYPAPRGGAAGSGGQGTLRPGYPAPRKGAAGSGGQGTLRPGYPAPRKGAAGPGGQGTLKPGYPAPRGGAAGPGGQGTLKPGYPSPKFDPRTMETINDSEGVPGGAAGREGQGTLKPGYPAARPGHRGTLPPNYPSPLAGRDAARTQLDANARAADTFLDTGDSDIGDAEATFMEVSDSGGRSAAETILDPGSSVEEAAETLLDHDSSADRPGFSSGGFTPLPPGPDDPFASRQRPPQARAVPPPPPRASAAPAGGRLHHTVDLDPEEVRKTFDVWDDYLLAFESAGDTPIIDVISDLGRISDMGRIPGSNIARIPSDIGPLPAGMPTMDDFLSGMGRIPGIGALDYSGSALGQIPMPSESLDESYDEELLQTQDAPPPVAPAKRKRAVAAPAPREAPARPSRLAGLISGDALWILLSLGGALIGPILVAVAWDYYGLARNMRPGHAWDRMLSPGGQMGLWFGIIGSVLFLLNLTYVLRRRFFVLAKKISLRLWLNMHFVFGLTGGSLILIHSALQAKNMVARASSAAIAVAIGSGIFGRYVLGHVARREQGEAANRSELAIYLAQLRGDLRRNLSAYPKLRQATLNALAQSAPPKENDRRGFSVIPSLVLGDLKARRLEKQLRRLLNKEAGGNPDLAGLIDETLEMVQLHQRLGRRLANFDSVVDLMDTWRALHMILALVMVVTMLLHVTIVLRYSRISLF